MKRLTLLAVFMLVAAGCQQSPEPVQAQAEAAEYVRYDDGSGTVSWGVLEGETIHQLSDAPYLDGERTGESVQRSDVTLEAPVDPSKSFMTAFNFRSHISGEPAEYPGLFTVPSTSINGPDQPIVRPPDSENFHYEAEAVVVVGREASNVPVEEASDYIFGITAGNDGSERSWQGSDIQWVRAKGSDTFNPVGPVLATGVDYNNVMIEGRLNGERVQGESTSDLIFDFDYMLSYISRYFTLKPGDLIWSGTMGSTQAMEPGDVYEVEIENVGVLRNELVQGEE